MSVPPYRYRVFGLEARSSICLPIMAEGGAGEPDIEIATGPIASDLDDDEAVHFRNWSARPGRLLLDVRGMGRFLISDGKKILVEPSQGVAEDALIPHVQGSALAALLQQRRLLPMHASCIETDRGTVLVAGPSGSGKSTLLSAFLARGYRMLADDVTAIGFDPSGRPLAFPAFPGVRLWRDSAEAAGHDVASLKRVRPELDKYYIPISQFRDTPQTIDSIIVYGRAADTQPVLREMPVEERFRTLAKFGFRKHFLRGQGLRDLQFATVSALAAQVRVRRLHPPARLAGPEPLADLVIGELGLSPKPAGNSG